MEGFVPWRSRPIARSSTWPRSWGDVKKRASASGAHEQANSCASGIRASSPSRTTCPFSSPRSRAPWRSMAAVWSPPRRSFAPWRHPHRCLTDSLFNSAQAASKRGCFHRESWSCHAPVVQVGFHPTDKSAPLRQSIQRETTRHRRFGRDRQRNRQPSVGSGTRGHRPDAQPRQSRFCSRRQKGHG